MARISYGKADDCGNHEETSASAKRRISELTGFKPSAITLLEGSLAPFNDAYYYYKSMVFSVNGKGFWTDFEDWDRDCQYDN